MITKVFALGRPGSGKSVAAHRLAEAMWSCTFPAIRLGDYETLHSWAVRENALCEAGLLSYEKRRFHLLPQCGFDVLDFAVLDESLEVLKRMIDDRNEHARYDHHLVIIEFARNNYQHAFEVLGREVLQDAFFLYVNADVEECIKRINDRTWRPRSVDDHYVSEHILRTYYAEDDGCDLKWHLGKYLVHADSVMAAENNGTPAEFAEQIAKISRIILPGCKVAA